MSGKLNMLAKGGVALWGAHAKPKHSIGGCAEKKVIERQGLAVVRVTPKKHPSGSAVIKTSVRRGKGLGERGMLSFGTVEWGGGGSSLSAKKSLMRKSFLSRNKGGIRGT